MTLGATIRQTILTAAGLALLGVPHGVLAAAASPGAEPACAQGCIDSRVLLVDRKGKVVWQYGKFGVRGAAPGELDTPVQARYLPGDKVLITDQGNHRVIEVDRRSKK